MAWFYFVTSNNDKFRVWPKRNKWKVYELNATLRKYVYHLSTVKQPLKIIAKPCIYKQPIF